MQQKDIDSRPEYGAIFMSNSLTKKECLRRKVFGLPSKFGHFVKQIRPGMILFLFEYEKRQLYGVFEACSDGGMNIVPHAYSKSGLNFPAQVKVKCIWTCDPLSEFEFHEAIKENYFTNKKFQFGLSEVQVSSLLQLFSRKKIRLRPSLTTARDARLIAQSADEGKQVDDGFDSVDSKVSEVRSATTEAHLPMDKAEIGHSGYQFGDLPSNDGFLTNYEFKSEYDRGFATGRSQLDEVERQDNKFPVYQWGRSEQCPDSELRSAMSAHVDEYFPEYVSRVPRDDSFLKNDELRSEYHRRYNGSESSLMSEYSSTFQSELGRSVLSGKYLDIRSSVQDQSTIKSSPIQHQMQERIFSNASPTASYRDAVVMSTEPYGSIVPSVNYRRPSIEKAGYQSGAEQYQPHFDYSGDLNYSSKLPSSSYTEGKGITQYVDTLSTVRDPVSFSGPNPSDVIYQGEAMGSSYKKYSKPLDQVFEKKNHYSGLSSPKYSSLPHFHSLGTRINESENNLSFYTSHKSTNSSMLDGYDYTVEPEDQLQIEAAKISKRESFVVSPYEDPFTSQASYTSINPQHLRDSKHNSLEYDCKEYQSSDALHTIPRKRTSVFSRLSSAQDGHVPEHISTDGHEATDSSKSVDEIMETLLNSHRRWVKLEEPKQSKRLDNVNKITRKKQTAGFDAVIENGSSRLANVKPLDFSIAEPDSKVGISLDATGMASHSAETNLCFNFKRRSEAKKLRGGMAADCDASARSEAGLGGRLKKRKLIRPVFGKCDSDDDRDVKKRSSVLPEQAEESSISKGNTGCYETSKGDENTENLQSPKEKRLICQSSAEHGVLSPVNPESLLIGFESGKGSLTNNLIVQNATSSSAAGEGENLDTFHNSALRSDTGNESGANESERNTRVELLPTARSSDEAFGGSNHCPVMEMMNCSIDQFKKMVERKEHAASIL